MLLNPFKAIFSSEFVFLYLALSLVPNSNCDVHHFTSDYVPSGATHALDGDTSRSFANCKASILPA